ncbi:Hypothetical protein NAEGRDRAFT_80560 [Naegleria gruberi]|uniref:RGS domain-containing protein n=1 Tax=Naegleria gruberi TaxID=5762 RepID=D2VMM6_NAEGR|nr:uncharacterized protein NAEGRDRAFT_80560 [Naegleria gruberi]EFC41857.1 Hypothetical protein NAEGRDRAFT_80560 [Naegleria gruberi]|eukprot:XP_002674601.1 Hypothetical protein NAEGRDRAFT_80560 [Naegleria gruberi strain NEG-M]
MLTSSENTIIPLEGSSGNAEEKIESSQQGFTVGMTETNSLISNTNPMINSTMNRASFDIQQQTSSSQFLSPNLTRERGMSMTDDFSSQQTDLSCDSLIGNDDDSVMAIDEIMYGGMRGTTMSPIGLGPTIDKDSLKRKGKAIKDLNENDIGKDTHSSTTGTIEKEPSCFAMVVFCILSAIAQMFKHLEVAKVSCGCCCSMLCCCLPRRYKQVKFSLVSLMSVLALVVNILVLLCIAAVTILQYISVSEYHVAELLTSRATAISSYNDMKTAVRLGAFNRGSVQARYPLQLYQKSKRTFTSSIQNILDNFPTFDDNYQYLNGSRNTSALQALEIFNVWELTINMTFNGTNMNLGSWGDKLRNSSYYNQGGSGGGGNRPPGGGGGGGGRPGGGGGRNNGTRDLPPLTNLIVAQFFMNTSEFMNAEANDQMYLSQFLDNLFNHSIIATHVGYYSNITSLVLLGLSILIVIPMVIVIFAISLKTSSANQTKLQTVNAVMVLDTMKDPAQRQRFQNYCLGNGQLEDCFNFLEEVRQYKELGNQSVQVQVELFEKSKELIENGKLVFGKNLNEEGKAEFVKSIRKSDKKLTKIEKQKQEMAFDIWTKYLEQFTENRTILSRVSISDVELLVKELDSFNNQIDEYADFDIITEDLFDHVEKQVAESLTEVHNTFQNLNQKAVQNIPQHSTTDSQSMQSMV